MKYLILALSILILLSQFAALSHYAAIQREIVEASNIKGIHLREVDYQVP